MHDDVIQLIERSKVAFPKVGNGVSQATVSNAEAALGIPLPESYKWWLLNYGGGQIKGDIVYGLDEGGMGRPDIVELAGMNEDFGPAHIGRREAIETFNSPVAKTESAPRPSAHRPQRGH